LSRPISRRREARERLHEDTKKPRIYRGLSHLLRFRFCRFLGGRSPSPANQRITASKASEVICGNRMRNKQRRLALLKRGRGRAIANASSPELPQMLPGLADNSLERETLLLARLESHFPRQRARLCKFQRVAPGLSRSGE